MTHFEAFSQLFDGLNLGQNPAKPPFSRAYGLIFGAKFSFVTGHSSRDRAVKIRIFSRRGSPCLSLWSFEEIYITNLIYSGVDPKTVQYLAGHENSKVTMDIYAKVKYNQPKELSKVVNQAFTK